MVICVVIKNGVVVNRVIADPEFAMRQGWIVSDTATFGDIYDPDTGTFTTPPPVSTL